MPGLDLAAVTQVDPSFTPDTFLLIARDAFRVLQDGHTDGAPALDADIASAEVTAASMVDGRERAVVRFGINGSTSVTQELDIRARSCGAFPPPTTKRTTVRRLTPDGSCHIKGWRLTGIAEAA